MGVGRKERMGKALGVAKEKVSLFGFRKVVGVPKSHWLFQFTLCSKTFQKHLNTPPSEFIQ